MESHECYTITVKDGETVSKTTSVLSNVDADYQKDWLMILREEDVDVQEIVTTDED